MVELQKQFIDFSSARILVVGDLMLDRYWTGPVSRISPEAPVPVVHVQKNEDRPGGAGNVALNIRALGSATSLMAVIGDDQYGERLANVLEAAKIDCDLQCSDGVPTVTKLRVISRHQQLVRLDFEESLMHPDRKKLINDYKKKLATVDAVILSDYGKGTLSNIVEFIQIARDANVPVFIDPKSRDFNDYRGATLITPNLKEFESVVGKCETEADIVQKGQALLKACEIEALLVTRSEKGMTLIQRDQPEHHIPTRAKEVYDVTGAGDTVIATMAAAVGSGYSFQDAMQLANMAAGIVVGKLGAATASAPELRRVLRRYQGKDQGVLNEEQLILAVAEAKAHGETVVMTNGCFDILHAGHVHYLKQAKSLGQRLIVAVNSDESVRALKGESRPINSLDRRMAVLAGLGSVDWVVPFSEETPARLYGEVLPDVLVKGGDYKVDEIAGAKAVLENGGKVEVLDFVDGVSTTNMVEKIKGNHE